MTSLIRTLTTSSISIIQTLKGWIRFCSARCVRWSFQNFAIWEITSAFTRIQCLSPANIAIKASLKPATEIDIRTKWFAWRRITYQEKRFHQRQLTILLKTFIPDKAKMALRRKITLLTNNLKFKIDKNTF